MKYNLKPEKKSKVRLFANSGEAIVFWLSIGGLIFLAIISIYRVNYLQSIINQYNSIGENINPVILKLEKLELENDSLRQTQDGLLKKIEHMKKEDELLKNNIEKLSNERNYRKIPIRKDLPTNIITLPAN